MEQKYMICHATKIIGSCIYKIYIIYKEELDQQYVERSRFPVSHSSHSPPPPKKSKENTTPYAPHSSHRSTFIERPRAFLPPGGEIWE